MRATKDERNSGLGDQSTDERRKGIPIRIFSSLDR
jgi:hypothetical protein